MSCLYKLNNIQFSYAEKKVLDIEQQSFEQGKITALVGANGAGKSTLLGLLSFISEAELGAIEFSGEKVTKNNQASLRKSVGLVQQNPYLIKGSVIKNIELGLKFRHVKPAVRESRAKDMLRILKIENLADRSVKSLSGGEAQKVAIGRALVLDPKVILLDEPFTYLDREFVDEFELLIKKLKNEQNKTIIFTTHNQTQAKALSDQVFSIVDGQLIEA
ncbi:MAG: ABC transporter ATP-binding protein [Gammaproteobacteria bacterium]|nr:ABC transporter ATP-binding protein [Gammaproteobacteria bacterium]